MVREFDTDNASDGATSTIVRGDAAATTTGKPAPAVESLTSELQAILQTSATVSVLQSRLLNRLITHFHLVGGAVFQASGKELKQVAGVLNHPALQHAHLTKWLERSASQAISARKDMVLRSPAVRNLALIATPFLLHGTQKIIVLLHSLDHSQETDPTVDALLLSSRLAANLMTQWEANSHRDQLSQDLKVTAILLELARSVDECLLVDDAAVRLANGLQDCLKADSVVIGLARPGRMTSSLNAMSGKAEFDPDSVPGRAIKAAIDEAIQRGTPAGFPNQISRETHENVALERLSQVTSANFVATVPLPFDASASGNLVSDTSESTTWIGSVCVIGVSTEPEHSGSVSKAPAVSESPVPVSDESVRLLRTLGPPLGASLGTLRLRQPGRIARGVRKLLLRRRSTVVTALAMLMAVATVLAIPLPYRIACSFDCEPLSRQYNVAPYDGLLEDTFVEPGDIVAPGTLLARMKGDELQLELSELEAEQRRADKQQDVYLADEDVAESYLAALDGDRIAHRMELLRHRLSQLEIRSQRDGIVLTGSLDRRQNYPVETGQLLFEVAPLSPLQIQVAVPDDEIRHVEVGMTVEFRPESDPERILTGTIQRIRPRSESIDQQNVFVAEVEIPNDDHALRPGMKGSARVVSQAHPLGWNLFHRAWDYLCVELSW